MARAVPPPEIIDLDDTSDSEMDYADFLTPEGEAVMGAGVEEFHFDPNQQGLGSYDETQLIHPHDYPGVLQEILQVFPDISHEHVHEIYNKHMETRSPYQVESPSQVLIEKILDRGPYPKERDKKKRKFEDRNSDDEEAARWKYADLRDDPEQYQEVAKIALSEAFRKVPVKFIETTYSQHSHYYGAYFAILEAEHSLNSARDPPFVLLRSRRVVAKTAAERMSQLEQQGYDFEKLKKEIESASQRHKKDNAKREADQEARRAEEAEDERLRAVGETMECQCCFDDFTSPKVTHCNGDDTHFFCLDCARQNANTDIGNSRYELRCMDGSGCKATFSRSERARFLDSKTIEKLERLQQQEEIRMAELQNLSMCPFCDFAAICPPVEEDREFRCHNPQCEEVSCRLCKAKTHIPISCEEFKKENGVSERRVIEEARTEALIRTCGKCKVRILKEDGCNKVICSSCSAVICDYCGKDISKQMYNHFDGQGRAPSGVITNGPGAKCPLYDESSKRKDNQVEQAEKEAMAKVRAEHPDLSEEDLTIKFAKSVQSPPKRPSHHHHLGHHYRHGHYDIDDFGLPQFGGFRVDPAVNDAVRRHMIEDRGGAEQPRTQTPEELYQEQRAQQQRFRQQQEVLRVQSENQQEAKQDRILQEQVDRLRRGREHVREAGERARAAGEQARAARNQARIAGEQAQAAISAAAQRRNNLDEGIDIATPDRGFEYPNPFNHLGRYDPGRFDPDAIFGANANPLWVGNKHNYPYGGDRGNLNGPINPNGPYIAQPQFPFIPPPRAPDPPRAPIPPRPDYRAAATALNERRRRQAAAAVVNLDPPTPPRPYHHNQRRPALENNDEVNFNPWLNGPGLNDQPPRGNQGYW